MRALAVALVGGSLVTACAAFGAAQSADREKSDGGAVAREDDARADASDAWISEPEPGSLCDPPSFCEDFTPGYEQRGWKALGQVPPPSTVEGRSVLAFDGASEAWVERILTVPESLRCQIVMRVSTWAVKAHFLGVDIEHATPQDGFEYWEGHFGGKDGASRLLFYSYEPSAGLEVLGYPEGVPLQGFSTVRFSLATTLLVTAGDLILETPLTARRPTSLRFRLGVFERADGVPAVDFDRVDCIVR